MLQISALTARAPKGVIEALGVLGLALAVWPAVSALVLLVLLVLLVRRREQPANFAFASVVLVGAAVALLTITAWLQRVAGTGAGAT